MLLYKKLLTLIVLLVLSVPAYTAERSITRTPLAVHIISNDETVSENRYILYRLYTKIVANLNTTENYYVTERQNSNIPDYLLRFYSNRFNDEELNAVLDSVEQRRIGVDYICVVQVVSYNIQYRITAQIMHIETGRVVAMGQYNSYLSRSKSIDLAAENLVGQLVGVQRVRRERLEGNTLLWSGIGVMLLGQTAMIISGNSMRDMGFTAIGIGGGLSIAGGLRRNRHLDYLYGDLPNEIRDP